MKDRSGRGAAHSFDEFAATAAGPLLRLAYLLAGNRADAEDLAQDSLLQVGRKWRRVRSVADPLAYSRRVMVNVFLSGKRRRQIQSVPLADERPIADRMSVEHDVVARNSLMQALGALPLRQRTAVVLRFYQDLDYHEIAAAMGTAESTVRSNVTRALRNLRANMTAEGSAKSHEN